MFKRKIYAFAQEYFYAPNLWQKCLSIALLPLSWIYCACVILKSKFSKALDFGIPIISIGNLTLGGSGKTPLGIAILSEFDGGCVVLRGYGRASQGLVKVAVSGEILVGVTASGDEAMEYAKSVKNANVIVSENRDIAINEAKKMGAKYVLLDDGFGKFHIKKFNVLIRPSAKPYFDFVMPSGAYRYPSKFYAKADYVVKEGEDFTRESEIINQTTKMVLVTAIANPQRLEPYFSLCVGRDIYPDHYAFSRDELASILERYAATSLLVTRKDAVKMEEFGLPLSVIALKTTLAGKFKRIIKEKIL
ncbi:tetraacyldisaccharide 4'-kinase [Campylobacter showae]|uniref:Tetraacyldisaccharide 4'-kinase n=1 Tax=Campylobacter showae RM3277 TaxID=553219 RepID=C6RCZ3_9BACT|nr:tetraacyldisaccharide 4'-kinase [Campylobacter showae]EET80851.1 tetraacyldisaccharide-1-P 4'-kinase [Campylobacter showae RM3277]QCD48747.1 tetraacyldisaccharide 4'-kinase [Campylobacter showae]